MCRSTATVNVDTEFRAPPECPREGDVRCKVVRADCEIIDQWDRWITFKLRLLLKLKVESFRWRECIFVKEIVVKDTVWIDGPWRVRDCEVKAAICKCIISRGKIHCNLTALVRFDLKEKDHCRSDWRDGCDWGWQHDHGCKDDCDHDVWEDDWNRKQDCDCDWRPDRRRKERVKPGRVVHWQG